MQEAYDSLLQSSTRVTNKLKEELQEVRSQLERERVSSDELRQELDDRDGTCAELRSQLALAVEPNKNSAPTVAEFPEAADLLNRLQAQRKKSRADLVDIEAVLEILST
ncbi:hypothetical protein [Microcoleus sp. herbarium14]|uniref:hypothetical protein n=1 Tax=Microcoleus sp. herbarium14 TaxID=3055439 RepID=UPI002FD49E3B